MDHKSGKKNNILELDYQDKIATLILNRPNEYNCLSEKMLDNLENELMSLEKNIDINVVVLKARGNAFCAGHDLKEMRENPSKEYYKKLFSKCSRVMLLLTRIPQPVIASVQGVAAAAGCQLVAACDLAVASSKATFATTGVNLALFCSTPSVAISRNLLRKKAAEMLFTGDLIDANAAFNLGLLNKVSSEESLSQETFALAKKIADKPRVAITTGKKMLYKQMEMGNEEAYQYAAEVMACNMMAPDTKEGIDAFLEKRSAKYQIN